MYRTSYEKNKNDYETYLLFSQYNFYLDVEYIRFKF